MGRWLRVLHRLHRALGAILCVLMLSWFASGAVMTFVGFPYYGASERLRDSMPVPAIAGLPPQVVRWLAGSDPRDGEALRLLHTATGPRWLFSTNARAQAVSAHAPYDSPSVDRANARAEAQRLVGASAVSVSLLAEPDQWTVPLPAMHFPMWRVELNDDDVTVLYIVQSSGEVVQRTSRSARLWAWLGAIPHWIYPTVLRQQRTLWKQVVITLASVGLVLSMSGLVIGADAKRRLRRRGVRARRTVIRDGYLRWHQRIGLVFGLFVSSWLFSGILSFTPFQWTNSAGLYEQAQRNLAGAQTAVPEHFLTDALAYCQRNLRVHELRYFQIASTPTVICLDREGHSRVVRLRDDKLRVEMRLPDTELRAVAAALGGPLPIAARQVLERADSYYYPTHAAPRIARPYWRIDIRDLEQTSYYFDPRLCELLQLQTRRLRLSRWLFQGLHSWDISVLYQRPVLWRVVVLSAMGLGIALSSIALFMALRRLKRRRRHARDAA